MVLGNFYAAYHRWGVVEGFYASSNAVTSRSGLLEYRSLDRDRSLPPLPLEGLLLPLSSLPRSLSSYPPLLLRILKARVNDG